MFTPLCHMSQTLTLSAGTMNQSNIIQNRTWLWHFFNVISMTACAYYLLHLLFAKFVAGQEIKCQRQLFCSLQSLSVPGIHFFSFKLHRTIEFDQHLLKSLFRKPEMLLMTWTSDLLRKLINYLRAPTVSCAPGFYSLVHLLHQTVPSMVMHTFKKDLIQFANNTFDLLSTFLKYWNR